MKTSIKGINLIKQFEGCRFTAYKPVAAEKYWTIGYGHYGPDVAPGMKISQAQADAYLIADLAKFEKAVDSLGRAWTQGQYDALVSFAYNCGAGNLKKLVANRTDQQIADTMLAYNKGSGKVLAGLVRRRQAERTLFLSGMEQPKTGNPYTEPTKNVKYGDKGNAVRWVQVALNYRGYKLAVNGDFRNKTKAAVIDFQHKAFPNNPEEHDGICGPKTREKLKTMPINEGE